MLKLGNIIFNMNTFTMSIKLEKVANEREENEVMIQSLQSRMPPLIPLPRPGHWVTPAQNERNNTEMIKIEYLEDHLGSQTFCLECPSCSTIVHSSIVLSCSTGHLMCMPCWSVLSMAQDLSPLNREIRYMDMIERLVEHMVKRERSEENEGER